MAKKYYKIEELESMYADVIKKVSDEMMEPKNMKDWEDRYTNYLDALSSDSKEYLRISRLKSKYKVEKPLSRYLTVSNTQKASKNVVFILRVYGFSVGELTINITDEIKEIIDLPESEYNRDASRELKILTRKKGISKVYIKKNNENSLNFIAKNLINNCDLSNELTDWIAKNLINNCDLSNELTDPIDKKLKKDQKSFDWDSDEMKSLRSIIKRTEPFLVNEKEASCENLLLNQLALSKTKDKPIKKIQPIKIGNSGYFQMPTCLKGSDAKKDKIEYSGAPGGGIDILARIQRRKSELCVIELKDKYEKNERPVLALKQAIAYAVCLDYIMRSKEVNSNHSWYRDVFMPNSKSEIPESMRINVVAAMPYEDGVNSEEDISSEDKSIAGKEIKIDVLGHEDTLELHYMFFKKEALQNLGIENGIVSSLRSRRPDTNKLNENTEINSNKSFKIGTSINHKIYGKGTIRKNQDGILSIKFENGDIRDISYSVCIEKGLFI